ncbi:MAG: glucuronate isomerase, partial [Rhodospirillales bacterium]
MGFIHNEFLLTNDAAVQLYHEYAASEPILDFHNHLSPQEISENRRFTNLAEIWLEGDHYKWRALRANGIPEELITGNGDPKEKYLAWAATIPHTLGNPLYHWTHLELKRCFDIDLLLSPDTAEEIWAEANKQLAYPNFSACGMLERFQVKALCTTDD